MIKINTKMKLNELELRIIKAVSEGRTYSEISQLFNISKSYVQNILINLYGKTGTENAAHLVSWAYKNKILGENNERFD